MIDEEKKTWLMTLKKTKDFDAQIETLESKENDLVLKIENLKSDISLAEKVNSFDPDEIMKNREKAEGYRKRVSSTEYAREAITSALYKLRNEAAEARRNEQETKRFYIGQVLNKAAQEAAKKATEAVHRAYALYRMSGGGMLDYGDVIEKYIIPKPSEAEIAKLQSQLTKEFLA